ncbi:hypothetical protein FA10DRAFT_54327 [Acaromyces ingoldii]|uniref:Uncharacterized protein n=1 Tax=Acaromyces ingoldii TaxID=215250 RepID=A0A316YCJ0_9BASI|nr:hypothetical protein FA10DRAFT_54327 [Acaromyces ingoldii]PWN86594.1 hypothetical protein FA10DRAFT_54327 [Acaromyces ingoldii]
MILSEPFGVEDPNLPSPPYPPSPTLSSSTSSSSSKGKKKSDKMTLSDCDKKESNSSSDDKPTVPSAPTNAPCCQCQCHHHGHRFGPRSFGRHSWHGHRHYRRMSDGDHDDAEEAFQLRRCRRRRRSRPHRIIFSILLLAFFLVTMKPLQRFVLGTVHDIGDHTPQAIVEVFNAIIGAVVGLFGSNPILAAWFFVSLLLLVIWAIARCSHKARRRRKWRKAASCGMMRRWCRSRAGLDVGTASETENSKTETDKEIETESECGEKAARGFSNHRGLRRGQWLSKAVESVRWQYANFPAGVNRYRIVLTDDVEQQRSDSVPATTPAPHSSTEERVVVDYQVDDGDVDDDTTLYTSSGTSDASHSSASWSQLDSTSTESARPLL